MRSKLAKQRGFSLIELAMVVVIVGMITAVAVPSLLGSKDAAEKAATIGTLRSMHRNQVMYHSTRGQFARLSELNTFSGNVFGTVSGTTLKKKDWVYLMSPTPTDTTLRSRYSITAIRTKNGKTASQYDIDQSGVVRVILP